MSTTIEAPATNQSKIISQTKAPPAKRKPSSKKYLPLENVFCKGMFLPVPLKYKRLSAWAKSLL